MTKYWMKSLPITILLVVALLPAVIAQTTTFGTLREESFSCQSNFGKPGDPLYCIGRYTVLTPGQSVVEVCIQPKPLQPQALFAPTKFTGQCVPGETFCFSNTVKTSSSDVGTVFSMTFAPKVPKEGDKWWNGYGNNYRVVKTSVNQCCVDGPCSGLAPYNFEKVALSDFGVLQTTTTPPVEYWEVCRDGTCEMSSTPNVFAIAPDTHVIGACKVKGKEGTGFGFYTQNDCVSAAKEMLGPVKIVYERCTESVCDRTEVPATQQAQFLSICSAQEHTGTGIYFDTSEECLKFEGCKGDVPCPDGSGTSFVCKGSNPGILYPGTGCKTVVGKSGHDCAKDCVPPGSSFLGIGDDSGASTDCSTGWCFDTPGTITGVGGKCQSNGYNRDAHYRLFSVDQAKILSGVCFDDLGGGATCGKDNLCKQGCTPADPDCPVLKPKPNETITIAPKAISLTAEEYDTATDVAIISAMCELPTECSDRDSLPVTCLGGEDVRVRNEEAVTRVETRIVAGGNIGDFCQGASSVLAKIPGLAILKGVGKDICIAKFSEVQVNKKLLSGTCRAGETGIGFGGIAAFFKSVGELLGLTGSTATAVGASIVVGLGLLILNMVFGRKN